MLAVATDWLPWNWTRTDAEDIREWMTAIGTVGAVLVAVGLVKYNEVSARRRRPTLSMSFDAVFGITIEVDPKASKHGLEQREVDAVGVTAGTGVKNQVRGMPSPAHSPYTLSRLCKTAEERLRSDSESLRDLGDVDRYVGPKRVSERPILVVATVPLGSPSGS